MCFLPDQVKLLVILHELSLVHCASLFIVLNFLIDVNGCFKHRESLSLIKREREILKLLFPVLVQRADLSLNKRTLLLLVSLDVPLNGLFEFLYSGMLDRVHIDLEPQQAHIGL